MGASSPLRVFWSSLNLLVELESRDSTSSAFCSWSVCICSSMVPLQMSLWTKTGFFWPILYARSVAWFSTAGFHHGS